MVFSTTARSAISNPRTRIVTSTGTGFGFSIDDHASVPRSSLERAEIPGATLTLIPGAADHPKPRILMRAQAHAIAMNIPTITTITTLGRNRARHAGQRPVVFGWTTPQAGQDIIFTIIVLLMLPSWTDRAIKASVPGSKRQSPLAGTPPSRGSVDR
jgi:hypothetical protein